MKKLPKDIQSSILDFIIDPKMKLVDWLIPYQSNLLDKKLNKIKQNTLFTVIDYYTFSNAYEVLSYDENAVNFLEKYPEYINWGYLSLNKNAIPILERNTNKLSICRLIHNPKAYESKILVDFIIKKSLRYDCILLSRVKEAVLILLEIAPEKIAWSCVSSIKDPEIINLLKNNFDKIDWSSLSRNPFAIELLNNNIDKIDWNEIVHNPNAIEIIRNNIDKIDLDELNYNDNGIEILKDYPERINFEELSISRHPIALEILKNNLDKVDWDLISENPNTYEIVKDNLDKINWNLLCENPSMVNIIKSNPENISWYNLCANPNPEVLEILKNNIDKIDWFMISLNPNIFEVDRNATNLIKNNYL